METTIDNEECLTDVDVARIMKVSRTTVHNYVRKVPGFPHPRRFRNTTRWLRSELNEFLRGIGKDQAQKQ